MNTLLIHQAFVSPKEGGGTRHYEFARHLLSQGHGFTVVASNLSYLTGDKIIHSNKLVAEEEIDGIRILRAYTYPVLHRGFVWRVISFLCFMCTSLIAGLRAERIDVVMGTSPPIFQALSAWLVATIRRRPFLLEIRDLWPIFAIDMGVLKSPVLIRLSLWLEGFLYACADHLLVNSPAYRDYLIKQGVAQDKISLVANGVDPEMFNPDAKGEAIRDKLDLAGKFVVSYTGALGLANDIQTILRAAERLKGRDDIHFLLVGDGKERKNLETMARDNGLANVTFTGSVAKEAISEYLAASDACVATLMDIPMFRTTYPNKVFDYMAASRPTLLGIDGVIREVIELAQGGIFVPPGDDAALTAAITALAADSDRAAAMGRSARNYVMQNLNRHRQAEQFATLLKNVCQGIHKTNHMRLKRMMDILLTILSIPLVLPVFSVTAMAVLIFMGRPVLFRQKRPGEFGRPFILYKFRTMMEHCRNSASSMADAERLTRLGKFLRSTSLDELPELFNVLKGDMSLVGPRPLLMQYIDRYTPEQMRRHIVKPGLTGWAQVNGRNGLTWEEKFKLDVWYVDNQSFLLDLKIIALTVWKIMKREGISQPGEATAKEFMGNFHEEKRGNF
jgi:lipopolysaccharide/colanic/teichoic acid biosynthesis glycosyltransferase